MQRAVEILRPGGAEAWLNAEALDDGIAENEVVLIDAGVFRSAAR